MIYEIHGNLESEVLSVSFEELLIKLKESFQKMNWNQEIIDFADKYQNAKHEHLITYYSRYLADEDGSYFKAYLKGSTSKGGKENVNNSNLEVSVSQLWRPSISIHNHPIKSRHSFSEAQPGKLGGLEGDYYMGVKNHMTLYLVTKGNDTILEFNPKKFYSLLNDDYKRWDTYYKGQKVHWKT